MNARLYELSNIAPESARKSVIQQALHDFDVSVVSIDTEAIQRLQLPSLGGQLDDFSYIAPDWPLEKLALLWLIFSAQAFQFKHLEKDGSKSKTHYMDMTGSAAVLSMIRDSFPLDGEAQRDALMLAFRMLPLPHARAPILEELLNQPDLMTRCVNDIIAAARNGMVSCDLAQALAKAFPLSFADPYLKKAQLAVSSIAGCVQHRESLTLRDDLTAFADYEVPRVLRAMGVLRYSDALAAALEQGVVLDKGSRQERALRGATILAVESISMFSGYRASQIDNYLWQAQKTIGDTPVHVTPTTYY